MTLGIFSVWFLLAIFLRVRWGSAVLTCVFFSCFGGAPPKAFEAGDSRSRSLESCCCSAVLEGASSNGFVSSLMDSKGDVRHFFGVVFASHFSAI